MMHTIIDASPRFRGNSNGGLYGDVVEEFDYETGRLLDVLDKQGLRDNTLVIYTSDNGPWNQPAYTNKKKGHPEGSDLLGRGWAAAGREGFLLRGWLPRSLHRPLARQGGGRCRVRCHFFYAGLHAHLRGPRWLQGARRPRD